MARPGPAPPESTVETACPLDCPDACSLSVTLRGGRIASIDGGRASDVTRGYICAKVRRFGRRVHGDDRLQHPVVRTGPKGSGRFTRVSWDDALDRVATNLRATVESHGGEAILPLSYGGSNGMLTQDYADAILFRRLGALRLLRTVCAAPTGAANMGLYGKMTSVVYQDYPAARLILIWGVNPGVSGIHLMPYLKEAREAGATLVVIDPRATTVARQADVHLAVRPGTDLVVALAIHRHLFEEGLADQAFLAEHTIGADALRERARPWTFERAAEVSGVGADEIRQVARLYASTSPALVKCGWGLERNRNGGSAAAAVLALPAIGGKFGVRGGGYSMSNSASWGIERTWLRDQEPATRAVNMNHLGRELTVPIGPPIRSLFVYNCNPAATLPDQARVLQGLSREDLFTVVFDQVLTDTAVYADVVLPATTFLEHYDYAKSYGPLTMQLGRPVIEPVGESRSNNEVFMALVHRLSLAREGDPEDDLDAMLASLAGMPEGMGAQLRETWRADPPAGDRPVQFVDVFPKTADGKVHLCPSALDAEAPRGLYGYQDDPASDDYPLALISPASDRTISSTLGELNRPDVKLEIHPTDAASRHIEDGNPVRVFNQQGEVHLRASVTPLVRPGTVTMPKGVWRRHTSNGWTANVLVPDTLADLGGGACFNDARVRVEKRDRASSLQPPPRLPGTVAEDPGRALHAGR
ncbi:MAG TPA: molybdopterin-dependent oxidoreductase [Vicinamibacterales bacterium]|nr:molybdopterin-dependent oxidoreductase [Vicinamibacterales bacterium]